MAKMTTAVATGGRRRSLLASAIAEVSRTTVRTALRRAPAVSVVEIGPNAPTAPAREAGRVVLEVRSRRAYGAVLREGSVGLARAYAEGWWESEDLVRLLRELARALPSRLGTLARARSLLSAARTRLGDGARTRNGGGAGRAGIEAHYDLGEEFFSLFLDPTLTYSSAYFEDRERSLGEASVAKLDRLCRKIRIGPCDRVLEIGTGWGSFALHAASRYGCQVVTTTISPRQKAYAEQKVKEAHLEDRVTVLGEDFRDLAGSYDKLVSIEMIEAVGWRNLDQYFSTCAKLLTPDGLMALQAIVIDDRLYESSKKTAEFIRSVIFPGSSIPSINSITTSLTRASDLRLVDLEDLGADYAETLHRWREQFRSRVEHIESLGFDERFVRMWDLYLAYCEAGFRERRISDVQLVLAKPGWQPALGERIR